MHIRTPCASIQRYDANLTPMTLDYEVYEVYDSNDTLIGKEIKGISKDDFDRLITNYGSAKSCCKVMNLNAIDINRVNSNTVKD